MVKYCHDRWRFYKRYYSQGIEGNRPLPIIGHSHYVFYRLQCGEYEQEMFKTFGSTYVDFLQDFNGQLVTSNKEYVKKILIKDFHKFYYRWQVPYYPLFARKAVIFLNKDWKRVRTLVTPIFSSGKLKIMFENFRRPIQNCLDNIKDEIDAKSGDTVDVKKLMRGYALDIIGHVIFSLKTNGYKNDEFSKRVDRLIYFNLSNSLCLLALPDFFNRFFKIGFLRQSACDYFAKLTLRIIEERKKTPNVVYNDFIEFLLKLETEEEIKQKQEEDGYIARKLSKEEIVGQAFMWFIAGLETVGTVLSLLLYELAVNQDAQEKLYKDLKTCNPNEEVTFDDLNHSKYLDWVVKETLRKHPTFIRIFRNALEDYDFGDFKIKKNQLIGISLKNLHYDPEIYKDPHKFIPERFEDSNLTNNTDGITFSPFLDGPRNCIGNRFAMIEMKSLVIKLIKKYRVFTTKRTEIPVRSAPRSLINIIEDVNLGFEIRTD